MSKKNKYYMSTIKNCKPIFPSAPYLLTLPIFIFPSVSHVSIALVAFYILENYDWYIHN